MRAAHAWRCFLQLPSDGSAIAIYLTSLIDTKCSITLSTEQTSLTIDPAYIVDVPPKGTGFLFVIETCFESQKDLGPEITALNKQALNLRIGPAGNFQESARPAIKAEMSDDKKVLLMGLHRLFPLPKFQQFVTALLTRKGLMYEIHNEKECKIAFKKLAGVESCRDLTEEAINSWRTAFNESLRGEK